MNLDIPQSETQRLSEMARLAGFDDVEEYVFQHVVALAHYGPAALPPLSDEELEASLAMCDAGMAQAKAGQTLSVEEARKKTLADLEASQE